MDSRVSNAVRVQRATRRRAAVLAAATVMIASGLAALPQEAQAAPSGRTSMAIPVGLAPYAVAVDAGTHTAYVANQGGGTVSVIDEATHAVSAVNLNPYSRAGGVRVRTPRGIAVDLSTHVVFAANQGPNAVKVITP